MNLKLLLWYASFAIALLSAASCTEWQTTPVTVDRYQGYAVNRMIDTQTMYPEHARREQQVMTMDGPRGEGIMQSYRKPAVDLTKGKERFLNLGIPRGSSAAG